MTKRRDWIKVRSSWWTTPSHADLSGDTLAFGVGLMWLADMDPEWQNTGFARLVDGAGKPLSVRKIGLRLRQDRRKVRRMLSELVESYTLTYDADSDCYIFPNYRDHQESRDARYKRECRQSTPLSVDSSATVYDRGRGRSRGSENNPPTPRKTGGATSTMASVADTEQVCAWIASARQRAGIGKARPPAVTEQTRREVRKPMAKCGASLEDWSTVINRQVAACRGDIDSARKYLTLSTLHRPGNFTRLLERDDLDQESPLDSLLPPEFR